MSGKLIRLPSQFDEDDRLPSYATPTCGGCCCSCCCCVVSTMTLAVVSHNDVAKQWLQSPLNPSRGVSKRSNPGRSYALIAPFAAFFAAIVSTTFFVQLVDFFERFSGGMLLLVAMAVVPAAVWYYALLRAYRAVGSTNPAGRSSMLVALGALAFGVELVVIFMLIVGSG